MREFKIGDKVKTIAQGYGVVVSITEGNDYPVSVMFKDKARLFRMDGKNLISDFYRSLYHADEQFVDPPKPMKKVKVGGWVSYFKSYGGDSYIVSTISNTEEEALAISDSSTVVYLETEIEVEE